MALTQYRITVSIPTQIHGCVIRRSRYTPDWYFLEEAEILGLPLNLCVRVTPLSMSPSWFFTNAWAELVIIFPGKIVSIVRGAWMRDEGAGWPTVEAAGDMPTSA
jgi:hypothetical protein